MLSCRMSHIELSSPPWLAPDERHSISESRSVSDYGTRGSSVGSDESESEADFSDLEKIEGHEEDPFEEAGFIQVHVEVRV